MFNDISQLETTTCACPSIFSSPADVCSFVLPELATKSCAGYNQDRILFYLDIEANYIAVVGGLASSASCIAPCLIGVYFCPCYSSCVSPIVSVGLTVHRLNGP